MGRRFVTFAVVFAVAAAVSMWKPWQTPVAPTAVGEPDLPADAAAVTVLKRSGGPCGVEIRGTGAGASNLASASLPAGDARSTALRFPAPYTVESVTVTRDGASRRHELNVTLAGGRRYDLMINPDDTVAIAPAGADSGRW